jgi:hypothetical protein
MIIRCKQGPHIVIGEMLWLPGCYLSVGNARGSAGAIVDLKALDLIIADLGRVRALMAARIASKRERKALA